MKKKYHVSRIVTYKEIVDVEADSDATALLMVQQGAARVLPRMVLAGKGAYTVAEAH